MSDDEQNYSPMRKYFIVGLIIALCIVATFISGSLYTCHKSDGFMSKGYRCIVTNVTNVCVFNDKTYIEKVPLYKELYSNGSLSSNYYVGGIPNVSS
jgi:hypothetical protein